MALDVLAGAVVLFLVTYENGFQLLRDFGLWKFLAGYTVPNDATDRACAFSLSSR